MILGIDPGVSGALAFLHDNGRLAEVLDMPVVDHGGKKRISAALLAQLILARSPAHAVVEVVGSRPGEGHAGAFAFGRSVGVIDGVLGALGIPITYVTPAAWKRHAGLSKDKTESIDRAIQAWPAMASFFARKKDDGRAEAALIARWGLTAVNLMRREP